MRTRLPLRSLLALLLTLFCLHTQAQQRPIILPVDSSLLDRARYDHYFSALDSARFPSGILLDYGLPLTDVRAYQRDRPALDPETWWRLYGTLVTSVVHRAATLPHPRLVQRRLDSVRTTAGGGPVELLLLRAPYECIADSAFATGALTFSADSQLVATSPHAFVHETLFAAAADVASDDDGRVRFIIRRALLAGLPVGTGLLRLDFDDGLGWRTVALDQEVTVTYATAGPKRIGVQLPFATPVEQTYAAFMVRAVPGSGDPLAYRGATGYGGANQKTYHFPLNDPYFAPVVGFEFPDDTYGRVYPTLYSGTSRDDAYWIDGATVTVSYGGTRDISNPADRNPVFNTSPLFRKPLVIVEGFDSWKFSGEDNYGFETFLNETERGINYVTFNTDGAVSFFSTQLADSGKYDLIFVDFENGTDDIRHNAMIVLNVLEWIEANRDPDPAYAIDPNDPNDENRTVIIGQSMGGLVARFALGYNDHHARSAHAPPAIYRPRVRLLVTRDSPHRGAVTPLGLQIGVHRLARQNMWRIGLLLGARLGAFNGNVVAAGIGGVIGGVVGSFLTLEDVVPPLHKQVLLLREGASRQLAIRLDDGTNDFREVEYRQMVDYPNNTASYRMVALANGSECGTPAPLGAGAELVRAEVDYNSLPVFTALMAAYFLQGGDRTEIKPTGERGLTSAMVGGILSAATLFTGGGFQFRAVVKGLPDPVAHPNGAEIWNASLWFKRRIGWRRFGFDLRLRMFHTESQSPAGLPDEERAPGGYFLSQLTSKLPGSLNWRVGPLVDNYTRIYLTSFNFVPTASAIDKPHPVGAPLTRAELFAPYSDTQPAGTLSRFNQFIAQEPKASLPSNTRHIQFTTRSARYVYKLMQNDSTESSCATSCGENSTVRINGPSNVCRSGNLFTSNAPGSYYPTWSVTGSLRLASPTDSSAARIYAIGNAGGIITLHLHTDCVSYRAVYDTVTTLDAPQEPGAGTSDPDYNVEPCSRTYTFTMPRVPGATAYTWVMNPQVVYTTIPNARPVIGPNSSPLVQATPSPDPPHWEISPVYGYGAYINVDYTAHSNCGTALSNSAYGYSLYACRPRPAPGDSTGVVFAVEPIQVYPNSSDVQFLAELQQDSIGWSEDPALLTEFKMYDLYGQERVSKTETDDNAEIPTQNLPEGPYILRVRRGTRQEMIRISVDH